jgi:hypothetical protein
LPVGQSEPTKYPIAITISAENRVVKAGFEASIMVRLENTSSRELDHSANINDHTGVDPNDTYDVRDSDGRLVRRKMYEHPEITSGYAVFRTVKPGESVIDSEPIGRLFDDQAREICDPSITANRGWRK